VITPQAGPRRHYEKPPRDLVEVVLDQPGFLPDAIVLPADAHGHRRNVAKALRELSTLDTSSDHGGIDLLARDPAGDQVKTGHLVLEGAEGPIAVSLDPVTRRFRLGGIAAGEYVARISSASGSTRFAVDVRAGDVVRPVVQLDAPPPKGQADVRIRVSSRAGKAVRVSGRNLETGRVVFDGELVVDDDHLVVPGVPYGRIHWYLDGGRSDSCYDEDHTDLRDFLDPPLVALKPKRRPEPDPRDWRFDDLDRRFAGVIGAFEAIGARSLAEIAALEPEAAMHLAEQSRDTGGPFADKLLLSDAIDDARAKLGLRAARGDQILIAKASGKRPARQSVRAAAGTSISVRIPDGKRAKVSVAGAGSSIEMEFIGDITLPVTAELLGGLAVGDLWIQIESVAAVVAKIVVGGFQGIAGLIPLTTVDQIESIYASLAVTNHGLGTEQPPAVMQPENIEMWLDRARTHMLAAGVCSINDLGRFRLEPMRLFHVGAYVAPARSGPIRVLPHYVFVESLSANILRYQPNDVLHETAVVLAGEWDIRGQNVIIGSDVRELVVIARRILFDSASRISWEAPALGAANSYWPNPAAGGANGSAPGQDGQGGAYGDSGPHPSRNGGRDAVTAAPIVTMYVLDSTGGLPPIDLGGQAGGPGGRGQDGGRGGDGAQGLRADGTFFGGCCRGVGHGGTGGRGGDGGRGGQGGRGGEGGKMTLLTDAPSIAVLAAAPPSIDLSPGAGGLGGSPGNTGSGGKGGPAGTADCETWCDEHPDRRGPDGAGGLPGVDGAIGDAGPQVVEDAFQILPITEAQWLQELNNPHILDVDPVDVEPGTTITITGQNFDPTIDRVYFDGFDIGPVASATAANATIPATAEGGYHPVVVRPVGATSRRSNRVTIRVLPVLDDIAPGTRWIEGQTVTLNGLAFRAGLTVAAEDRSVSPAATFSLPVVGVTRTSISVAVPGAPMGALRGVRRVVVRNPDGGSSRAERVVRISDTIVVRCAAFRVVGMGASIGTTRTDAEIADLFAEGPVRSVNVPWGQARIAFRLVQPVTTLTVDDDLATVWPILTNEDQTIFTAAPGVLGSLNVFFVRDVEVATAYAYFGGGPIFMGDEGGPLGDIDWQQVVAHEIGHALCLRHICDGGEGPGTFFNHACGDSDEAFLMYPFWDASNGMAIDPGQVAPARMGASHLEDGKINALPVTDLFQAMNNIPQCQLADAAN
jgi:hypothetical protein